jgi:hypothetical protein
VMARNGRNAAQAVLRDLGRVPAGGRT